ncbi:MAG TPA: hypothetical protein ENI23_02675 [bacterium]|nr:hypothetical protein [bacterium]
MTLYHSSKTPDIKALKPFPNNGVDGESVVFATDDKLFAVAMTYGTGDELAVGYYKDAKSKDVMFIDELDEGKLSLLDNPTSLYEVDSSLFKEDSRLFPGEFISTTEVPVVKETKIDNVFKYLKRGWVEITAYKDVPEAMERRKREVDKPEKEHATNRFDPANKS